MVNEVKLDHHFTQRKHDLILIFSYSANRSNFDSRTFLRSSGSRALMNNTFGLDGDDSDGILSTSPIKFSSQTSFYKISSPQLSNLTFDRDLSPGKNV
jgi:hypothetical protein